jgi:hypothetical protein
MQRRRINENGDGVAVGRVMMRYCGGERREE